MKIPQLFCGALAIILSVTACQKRTSQAELKQTASETATRIQTQTVKTGEKLADIWLETKIHSKFVGDRDIKARDVSVTSHDGIVTLKGRVLNESAHQLALTIAKNTNGVKQVVDNLDVEVAGPPPPRASDGGALGAVATTGTSNTTPSTSSPSAAPANSDDLRITTSIQSKYFMDDRIKGRHINVASKSGIVTLTGEVADDTERAEALLLARTTEGVTRVEDNLTISPGSPSTAIASSPASPTTAPAAPPTVAAPAGDAALADRVKSQLSSDTQMKNAPLEVTANSGVVMLQGTMPTSAAKEHALTVVRGIDGVTQVVDRIQVSKPVQKHPTTKGSTTRKAKR